MEPLVGVVIPAYRDPSSVRRAVAAIRASRGVRTDIVIVNNDPAQDGAELAGEVDSSCVRVIDAGFNSGFSGAINRGVRASEGEFVFFHNQDLELEPGCLATLAGLMAAHPDAACAGPKLLRPGSLAIIDSAGITMTRSRRAFDRGEGEADTGQFDQHRGGVRGQRRRAYGPPDGPGGRP